MRKLAEPLVGAASDDGRSDASLIGQSPGRRVWNTVVLCMSAVFAAEAAFLIGTARADEHAASPEVRAAAALTNALTEPQLRTRAGLAVLLVGAGQLGLCLEPVAARRLHGSAWATGLNVAFFVGATLLVALEVMLAIVACMLEDTGAQPWASLDGGLPELSEDFRLVLLGLLVQLVVSVVLVLGSVLLKALELAGTLRADETFSDAPTFRASDARLDGVSPDTSYGSRERLDHMRSYYAQLYRDNGLQVPHQLTPSTSNESADGRTAKAPVARREERL
jgi:hypothetical protein